MWLVQMLLVFTLNLRFGSKPFVEPNPYEYFILKSPILIIRLVNSSNESNVGYMYLESRIKTYKFFCYLEKGDLSLNNVL